MEGIQKPVDLIIRETKENIINAINQSNLPLGVIKLIVDEICGNLANQYNVYIRELEKQYEEQKSKELEGQDGE
jgi:nitrogen fixation/metabolism regulation signal transduction histidine kinase